MTTSALWRKRSLDTADNLEVPEAKKPRGPFCYIRLESESNTDSTNDDTESIYSIQGKETDVVKDTSDTESSSTDDEYDIDVEIEYDIDSRSEDSDGYQIASSTDSDEAMLAAAVAAACDSSFDAFVTDAEDSDTSQYQQDDTSMTMTDFWTCIQCKSQNDNPQYRFCDKCFQDRKTFFPPRPRRHKKKNTATSTARSATGTTTTIRQDRDVVVKLNVFKSCLNGLSQSSTASSSSSGASSQDSGLGSSQELPLLNLDQIVIPGTSRKRQLSESSVDEEYEIPKRCKTTPKKQVVDMEELGASKASASVADIKEICIVCNTSPKNSVFLHGRIAHMCCCYRCAMRTWKSMKRCPICNRKVSNVVRVFTN